MKCYKCELKAKDKDGEVNNADVKKAVIKLQNGAYCKEHFLNYLEEKVTKTIRKYHLIDDLEYAGDKNKIQKPFHWASDKKLPLIMKEIV